MASILFAVVINLQLSLGLREAQQLYLRAKCPAALKEEFSKKTLNKKNQKMPLDIFFRIPNGRPALQLKHLPAPLRTWHLVTVQ